MPAKKNTKKQPLKRRIHTAVKKAAVPHKANQYRPHLIRSHGLAIVVTLIMAVQLGSNFVETGSVLGQQVDVNADQLLADTNTERQQFNEQPLRLNTKLSEAASLKANDMFKEQYWAHTSPSGKTPWQWFKQVQYSYDQAGENLARGFTTSSGIVTAWMNSSEHRANILNDNYQDVGFAVKSGTLDGHTTTLVVAFYGEPSASGVVLGSASQPVTSASGHLNLIARLGVAIQSMTPVLLGSILLIMGVIAVALVAHTYRDKLPVSLRRSWLRHHALYKAVAMSCLIVVLLALYGGGQI